MSQTEVHDIGSIEREPDPGSQAGQREGASNGFWGSMPRVLTALGGLVTALATAAAVYFGGIGGGGGQHDPTPPTQPSQNPVIVLTQPAAPPPSSTGPQATSDPGRTSRAFSGQDTGSGVRGAEDIYDEWVDSLDSDTLATAKGCANGYMGNCEDMLDILVGDCQYGDPLACDVLFLASPSGSALEEYGDTCGGRVSQNDEWCRDLASS